MIEILALIPARSGSKSVVDKNIRMIGGKPMLCHSIDHAKQSRHITRVIVSTDSEKYAAIAKEYGAEVPFLRPAEYATDTSLDIDVFDHALHWLKEQEGYEPEIVVHLRPTYPIREVSDVDAMIGMMLADEEVDCVRSVVAANEIPYKMWHMSQENTLEPLIKDIPECYNMPRQQLPKVYYHNGCIDVVRSRVILQQHSMTGEKIAGYLMDENFDIDTEEEFAAAEKRIARLK